MSADRWFERCDDILAVIRTTQRDNIKRAAMLITAAAKAGGGLHFFDTGHCSREPIHRGGGLCMFRPLNIALKVDTHFPPKRSAQLTAQQREIRDSSDEQIARLGVARSGLSPGDVLIINSVSGKAALTVEVALSAQALGAKIVAITNVSYSLAVNSQHSSGKRLCEVADVVLDNCGVVGDGVLNMEKIDTGVAPTSGVTFCYLIWALVAEAIAQMQAAGLNPHVYRSVNLPDGEEFNARAEAAYQESGV